MNNDAKYRLVDMLNSIADQAKYVRNNLVRNPDLDVKFIKKEIRILTSLATSLEKGIEYGN